MKLPIIASVSACAAAALPLLFGRAGTMVVVLGVTGVLIALLGLLAGRPGTAAGAATFLLVQLAFSLDRNAPVAWWVIGSTVLLLIYLDGAAGSNERRRRLPGAFGPQNWRLLRLGGAVAATVAVVLAVSRIQVERGLLVQAAGLGAAAMLILTVVLLVGEAE